MNLFRLSKNFISNYQKYTKTIISEKDEFINSRLDRYIVNKYGLHWNSIQRYFRQKDILLQRKGEIVKNIETQKLFYGDEIFIHNSLLKKDQLKLNKKYSNTNQNLNIDEKEYLENIFHNMVVFKSDEFFILDKMCNLSSQGGTGLKFSLDSILSLLNEKYPSQYRLKLVHRLDKNVTGLMIVANDLKTTRKLGEEIKSGNVEKLYMCLTQEAPSFIHTLFKKQQINFNHKADLFFSGIIKSDENCDRYCIQLKNGYNFDENMTVVKAEHGNLSEFNMIGKFKISHLIFYINNNFQAFNMEHIDKYSFQDLEFFLSCLNNPKSENYSIVLYELITGKKHQIRKQMSKCFLSPILNERDYLLLNTDNKTGELQKIHDSIFSSNKNKEPNLNFSSKFKLNEQNDSLYLNSFQVKIPKINISNEMIRNERIDALSLKSHLLFRKKILPRNFQELLLKTNLQHIISHFSNIDGMINI
jgi:23S rRNA-/tRNA-specific pseudouridylate synthase